MKIVCVSTSRIPSDTANSIQVMKTCQAMASLGHAVHLLVPQVGRTGPLDPAEWPELAEHYGLSTPFDITWLPAHPRLKRNDFTWTAARQAWRQGANLLYTWAGPSAAFGLLQLLPVAFEVHDLPTGRLGPGWLRAFLQLPGKKRLLPITRALLDQLKRQYGAIPPEQVVILPNGVDLEQYQDLPEPPAARRALGLPEALTVSCSGHLYAGRGADLFMDLARAFPMVRFLWVGGRPEDVAACQARAEAQGLSNVLFAGFVPQRRLPCYQAASDVLLMPYARSIAGSSGGNSADICSPMKMFDYLAAGRAILTSDLPVIHEVLSPATAVFAPPEDRSAWKSALNRLLSDAAWRQKLSVQARKEAESYSWRARAARALAGFVA